VLGTHTSSNTNEAYVQKIAGNESPVHDESNKSRFGNPSLTLNFTTEFSGPSVRSEQELSYQRPFDVLYPLYTVQLQSLGGTTLAGKRAHVEDMRGGG
jgi:hypothetical protein